MDQAEIRLRLIEAAARNPLPHPEGFAVGVLATARLWENYVQPTATIGQMKAPLGLPKKAV